MFNLSLYKEKLYTNFFGQVIKYYQKLDSTNTKAWELISKNTPNGTVIITDDQLKGRGRQSNKWLSIPGKSLTFSITIYPNARPSQINLYSLTAGLATTDCLIKYDIQAQLKWPNDILINGKKVGGILCESKISGGIVQSMVIGIGLNINETIEELPEILRKNATSLMIESGTQFQLEILLANIINHFEQRFQNQDEVYLHILDWERRCAHLSQKVTFHSGNEIVTGIFKGLSSNGQAIISKDGEEVVFDSGEIVEIDD